MTTSRFGTAVPNVFAALPPAAAYGGRQWIRRAELAITTSSSNGTGSVTFPARAILVAGASETDSATAAPFAVACITSISTGTVNVVSVSLGSAGASAKNSGAVTVWADFY